MKCDRSGPIKRPQGWPCLDGRTIERDRWVGIGRVLGSRTDLSYRNKQIQLSLICTFRAGQGHLGLDRAVDRRRLKKHLTCTCGTPLGELHSCAKFPATTLWCRGRPWSAGVRQWCTARRQHAHQERWSLIRANLDSEDQSLHAEIRAKQREPDHVCIVQGALQGLSRALADLDGLGAAGSTALTASQAKGFGLAALHTGES